MNSDNKLEMTISNESPKSRTLSLIGVISSIISIIPWLLFWGVVIPIVVRCDYSSTDLDDVVLFLFCGVPLIIFCAILGGMSGLSTGKIFYFHWSKPLHAKIGAILGGFAAAFLIALGMMLFYYSPWINCK